MDLWGRNVNTGSVLHIWYILNPFIVGNHILFAQFHWSYFCRTGRVQSPRFENPSRKIGLLSFGLGWRDRNKVKSSLSSLCPNFHAEDMQFGYLQLWVAKLNSKEFTIGCYASPTNNFLILKLKFTAQVILVCMAMWTHIYMFQAKKLSISSLGYRSLKVFPNCIVCP